MEPQGRPVRGHPARQVHKRRLGGGGGGWAAAAAAAVAGRIGKQAHILSKRNALELVPRIDGVARDAAGCFAHSHREARPERAKSGLKHAQSAIAGRMRAGCRQGWGTSHGRCRVPRTVVHLDLPVSIARPIHSCLPCCLLLEVGHGYSSDEATGAQPQPLWLHPARYAAAAGRSSVWGWPGCSTFAALRAAALAATMMAEQWWGRLHDSGLPQSASPAGPRLPNSSPTAQGTPPHGPQGAPTVCCHMCSC